MKALLIVFIIVFLVADIVVFWMAITKYRQNRIPTPAPKTDAIHINARQALGLPG